MAATHFVEYDQPASRNRAMAICGEVVDRDLSTGEPTCARCRGLIAEDDRSLQMLQERTPPAARAPVPTKSHDTYVTSARLERGRMKIRHLQQMTAVFKDWKDGDFLIRFERVKATRSAQANRYYWGVIIDALADHTGYTPEETHQALKQLFLPKRCAMLNGNGEVAGDLVLGGSTTALAKAEFTEYCTRIREWARETLNVDIPAPESVAA